MAAHLIFLCAQSSSRSMLAASLLLAHGAHRWDIWSTPTQDEHGRTLAERVLREQGISPISPNHVIQPTFGMRWDVGIVLCSGTAAT